jgi:hypothetical protein
VFRIALKLVFRVFSPTRRRFLPDLEKRRHKETEDKWVPSTAECRYDEGIGCDPAERRMLG